MEPDSIVTPVQLERIFCVGQRVTVGVRGEADEDEQQALHTCSVDQLLTDSVVLKCASPPERLPLFLVGASVVVHLLRLGVRFCLDATVAATTRTGLVRLEQMRGLRRDDQRAFVRVETLLEPLEFEVKGSPKMTARVMLPKVVDISLGGFGLSCLNPIPVGSRVRVLLDLPKIIGSIEFEGQVLRVVEPANRQMEQYRMGLEFIDISERDRDRIAGFVLYQQQSLRKKGLQ